MKYTSAPQQLLIASVVSQKATLDLGRVLEEQRAYNQRREIERHVRNCIRASQSLTDATHKVLESGVLSPNFGWDEEVTAILAECTAKLHMSLVEMPEVKVVLSRLASIVEVDRPGLTDEVHGTNQQTYQAVDEYLKAYELAMFQRGGGFDAFEQELEAISGIMELRDGIEEVNLETIV